MSDLSGRRQAMKQASRLVEKERSGFDGGVKAERNRILELVRANYTTREMEKSDPTFFGGWNQAVTNILAEIEGSDDE